MRLTPEEERMLSGAEGEAARWAMKVQVQTGEFFGADRLLPVTHAHIVVNVEVMGRAGYELVERFAAEGARFRVPCSTNAQFSAGPVWASILGQDLEMLGEQERVDRLLGEMGASVLNSCIPYQCSYQPHFREHVAWGDTGTVCYSNSVFGSRSNFEAGAASLAAALTGRVPEYGFHLDSARRPTVLARLDADLSDYADWGALGAYVGRYCGNYWEVPVFTGVFPRVRSDELKHLAAALASYGSVAMFGIERLTPEAMTLEEALGGSAPRREVTVGRRELDSIFEMWASDSGDADLVVFSGPQQSLFELRMLAEMLEGKRVHENTQLIVTSNHGIAAMAEKLGYLDVIRRAGGIVLEGVCFYILELDRLQRRHGWRTVVTNSAKVSNIIGSFDYQPVLRRTADCIRSAITGRVVEHVG